MFLLSSLIFYSFCPLVSLLYCPYLVCVFINFSVIYKTLWIALTHGKVLYKQRLTNWLHYLQCWISLLWETFLLYTDMDTKILPPSPGTYHHTQPLIFCWSYYINQSKSCMSLSKIQSFHFNCSDNQPVCSSEMTTTGHLSLSFLFLPLCWC